MIEPFAKPIAHLRDAAIVMCLLVPAARSQTADPGAANPPAPSTAVQPPYTPLTEGQRLHNYLHSLYGPMSLLSGAVSAGYGQLQHRPREWQLGAEGYGMRYGSGYAQRIVRETLIFGSSSILHQDNRYFHSTETTTGPRIKHAILSTFTARKDDGSTTFSYTRIGGMLGGSLISRTWQPPSTGSINSAMANFGTSVGVAAGLNVVKEFLPKRFRFGSK
jgi:hypothetical protein